MNLAIVVCTIKKGYGMTGLSISNEHFILRNNDDSSEEIPFCLRFHIIFQTLSVDHYIFLVIYRKGLRFYKKNVNKPLMVLFNFLDPAG